MALGPFIKELLHRRDFILQRIIALNVAVYLFLAVIQSLAYLLGARSGISSWILHYFSLPASPYDALYRPWTIITYMFLHGGLWHLLFNMLWLYWLGRIFLSFQKGPRMLWIYLWGGIAGGLLYMLFYNLAPGLQAQVPNASLIGASAGVLAVVAATAALVPDYTLHLLLIGPVRLKYLALIAVLLDLIGIGQSNAGGHIAHLGGAFLGFAWVLWLRGKFPGQGFLEGIGRSVKGFYKPSMKTHKGANGAGAGTWTKKRAGSRPSQEVVDAILDKISEKGYESLSSQEKEILFKAGKE